jgi:Zn-dependent peptidase ImmA (M78 family)
MNLLSELQQKKANADQVLEALGLNGTHPIDPFEIIDMLGIHLKILPEDVMTRIFGIPNLIEGFSFKDQGKYYIAVGDSWTKDAQKFVAAHELGNVILHNDLIPIHKISNQKWIREKANTFAVNLLMPKSLVKKYGHLPLRILVNLFDIPPRAVQIRVASVY